MITIETPTGPMTLNETQEAILQEDKFMALRAAKYRHHLYDLNVPEGLAEKLTIAFQATIPAAGYLSDEEGE